jgi:hypothetical protein
MKACDAILTWPAYYNLVGIQKVIISFVKWILRIVWFHPYTKWWVGNCLFVGQIQRIRQRIRGAADYELRTREKVTLLYSILLRWVKPIYT